MNKTKNWMPELQSFSGLAIIFVVLIHATAYYLFNVLQVASFEQADYTTRLVDNLIHGAVPIFIFIAGYKYQLNDLNMPYKEFVKKRLGKVFKPFLIISVIFFIKSIIDSSEHISNFNLCEIFLKIFIGYNAAYQLWYVPMYIIISLTYPILCKIISNERFRIIFILGIIIIQYSLSWYSDLLASHPFDFVYYYFYFQIGAVFCKYDLKDKLKRWDTIVIATYVLITLLLTLNTGDFLSGPIKRFILWPASVIAYYFLVMRIKENKLLQYLGKYSFYIFLLHEPIFCTDISVILKAEGIYHSVSEVFIVGLLTVLATMLLYKIIENTFIKKLLF